ncbi:MAG: hypothetical protein K0S14_3124 [Thermomicrobiales bacterium]|nr:hypothetical protein [Thermomicrobiales bacterium]
MKKTSKKEPKFEGEVMLRMWVTVPLKSKTFAEAAQELANLDLDDVRLVPDNDVIDYRFESVAVRDRDALDAGGL